MPALPLLRCTEVSAPPPADFELEWFGTVWLPEDLHYVVIKFSTSDGGEPWQASGAWGTDAGRELQAFMKAHRRPLLWADSDDSGWLIDPVVGGVRRLADHGAGRGRLHASVQ